MEPIETAFRPKNKLAMKKALRKEGRSETKEIRFNDWNAYLAGKCYLWAPLKTPLKKK